jgi:hypothetical protein
MHAGMLVDDGRTAFQEARDYRVQSRVLVHAFALAPFLKVTTEGITSARRAQQAGEAAMLELQTRRRGLALATLLILAFLGTLWLKIRRLPPPSS